VVPLQPGDKRLTWAAFLERFRERLLWIAQQERSQGRDPQQILEREWSDRVGGEAGSLESLPDNPKFQELLSAQQVSPSQFPQSVKESEGALESLLEVSDLELLMQELVPHQSD
jgi:hypothetical protein